MKTQTNKIYKKFQLSSALRLKVVNIKRAAMFHGQKCYHAAFGCYNSDSDGSIWDTWQRMTLSHSRRLQLLWRYFALPAYWQANQQLTLALHPVGPFHVRYPTHYVQQRITPIVATAAVTCNMFYLNHSTVKIFQLKYWTSYACVKYMYIS